MVYFAIVIYMTIYLIMNFFVFYYYINNKALYSDEKIHAILYKLLNKSYLTRKYII